MYETYYINISRKSMVDYEGAERVVTKIILV